MGQWFKETAHHNIDKEKFDNGWDRIFGSKKKEESTSESSIDAEILFIETRLDKLGAEIDSLNNRLIELHAAKGNICK